MNERIIQFVVTQDIRQIVKFAIVGCLNVLVSFVVFYLCYRQWPLATVILDAVGAAGEVIKEVLLRFNIDSIDGAFANTIGYMAGMVNSFTLNKLWTFEAKGRTASQIHRFFVLNILGLVLSTLIMFVFVDLLNASYLVVWPVTIGLVMIINFIGNKYWTFSEASALEDASKG